MSGSRLLLPKYNYIFRVISSTTIRSKCNARYLNNRLFQGLDYTPISTCKLLRNSSSDSKLKNDDVKSMSHEEKEKWARDTLSLSLKERFKVFTDEDSEVILDADEINRLEQFETQEEPEYSVYSDEKDEFVGCNLKRGTKGVFEIEDLVAVLRQEKAKDICVIRIPPELHYADYLVLISAISPRHAVAMTQFLRKLHKRKKYERDPYVDIVGKKTCNEWKLMDFGNIVLHVFLPETRQQYDLESLWTVGREYDELTRRKSEIDKVLELMQSHVYSHDEKAVFEKSNLNESS